MRGLHLKRYQKARVVASGLLQCNQYVRQYYTEHYYRDIIIEMPRCITWEIKSRKSLLTENIANPQNFQPLKFAGYTVTVYDLNISV